MLANDEWKYDEIPEIMDGKNIADFVDPDILQRLEALEREEEMLEKKKASMMEESEEELDEDMLEAYDEIRNKQALKKIEHNMKIRNRAHGKMKDASEVAEKLEDLGIQTDKFKQRI
jgi:nucleolar GTP-binding protein